MVTNEDTTPFDQAEDDALEDAYRPVEDDGAPDDEPVLVSEHDPVDDDADNEDDPDDDETRILTNDQIPPG